MSDTNADRAASLAWLMTTDGQALLSSARALPDDRLTRLTRLRRSASPQVAAAVVQLLELRRRARTKFAGADEMFFTPDGLEQATGDTVAAYHAARFPEGAGVLDACCGIGGDARLLAARGPVVAVDRDPAAAVCTRRNVLAWESGKGEVRPVCTLCADVTSLPLKRLTDHGISAAFFDPSRRADGNSGGRRRLRSTADYRPPLAWADALRAQFASVAVKVSPAVDDESLIGFPDARIEFISHRGECKEAVLWFGPLAEALTLPDARAEPYFATVLQPGAAAATLAPFRCPDPKTRDIGDFLYEPDPAVIRAHLIPQLAAELAAAWIEPGVPYLISDRNFPTPFASVFRVVDSLGYNLKEIQRRLRVLGAHIYAVKKRGVLLEPIDVQKALAPCGNVALNLLLMRRAGRIIAILCERLDGPSHSVANPAEGS